jgi:hypothetical protein
MMVDCQVPHRVNPEPEVTQEVHIYVFPLIIAQLSLKANFESPHSAGFFFRNIPPENTVAEHTACFPILTI